MTTKVAGGGVKQQNEAAYLSSSRYTDQFRAWDALKMNTRIRNMDIKRMQATYQLNASLPPTHRRPTREGKGEQTFDYSASRFLYFGEML